MASLEKDQDSLEESRACGSGHVPGQGTDPRASGSLSVSKVTVLKVRLQSPAGLSGTSGSRLLRQAAIEGKHSRGDSLPPPPLRL